ncbi:MAG: MauE/DoxX family redox-associated membrane protein [Desulfobacterales bacterium]
MNPGQLNSGLLKWVLSGLRIALGGTFVWAGWIKIADPQGFAAIIGNYHLLPAVLVNPFAILLPWIEVLCGILLIGGAWIDGSLLIVNALMVVFIAALLSTWVRGIDVDCGCFSVANTRRRTAVLTDIIRDAAFLGTGLWLALHRWKTGRR